MTKPAAVIQLLGFPGTGKYTVGCEIVRLLMDEGNVAKLLDNHATANLIFDLVPPFGRSGIPAEVMGRVNQVRDVVLTTIEEMSPIGWSFVFTNFVPPTAKGGVIERHRSLAARRGATFLPVVLECQPDEIARRVVGEDRRRRIKLVDPELARHIARAGMTIPEWPELRRLDVTSVDATEAAHTIVGMLPG